MDALKAILSNRSETTAAVGVVVALAAKFGLALDDSLVLAILGIVAFVIGNQAATNHGAAAAAISAAAPTPASVTVQSVGGTPGTTTAAALPTLAATSVEVSK